MPVNVIETLLGMTREDRAAVLLTVESWARDGMPAVRIDFPSDIYRRDWRWELEDA